MMASVQVVTTYPSQRWRLGSPPVPMLLDTCTLRHLHQVMSFTEGEWTLGEGDVASLARDNGPRLGQELVALADLLALYRAEPPWLVSRTSLVELGSIPHAADRVELVAWWQMWTEYFWGGWGEAFPELDETELVPQPPDVHPDQLSFLATDEPERSLVDAPSFGPFRHAGDRALIRDAYRGNVPAILTTDLRSFWRHRRWLYWAGVEIWRPSDLWTVLGGPSV